MFRRIQNESLKKDCIWVRIRGAFLAKKGAPKLNFHREGGAVAPICPPLNPPLQEGGNFTLYVLPHTLNVECVKSFFAVRSLHCHGNWLFIRMDFVSIRIDTLNRYPWLHSLTRLA